MTAPVWSAQGEAWFVGKASDRTFTLRKTDEVFYDLFGKTGHGDEAYLGGYTAEHLQVLVGVFEEALNSARRGS